MDIQREKEFVSQYHYDARNFEWEKENGTGWQILFHVEYPYLFS